MLPQEQEVEGMGRVNPERPGPPNERQVVGHSEDVQIERYMMRGAEAQDVGEHVRSVMGPSQRPDVRRLGIGPGRGLDVLAADLAAKVVESFDVSGDGRVAHDPGDDSVSSLGRSRRAEQAGLLRDPTS